MKYLIRLVNGLVIWADTNKVQWLQAHGRILYIMEVKG